MNTPTDPRPKTRRRIPWFFPVPVAPNHNAWLPGRQVAFIAFLAQTRSVSEAAERVEMARQGAYRLRQHPWAGSFAAAWDAALGLEAAPPCITDHSCRKSNVTLDELEWRYRIGLWRPVMRNRRLVNFAQKPCPATLFQLLARHDRACRNVRESDAWA